MATSIARRMQLRDEENAIGEVLVALVDSMVPSYDGLSDFNGWAHACTVRKLIDQRRLERRSKRYFVDPPPRPARLDRLPSRAESGGDLKFVELAAELSDQQALLLWLRYYRGLSVEAVAELLNVSPSSVKAWTRVALRALKIRWPSCPSDGLLA